MSATHRPKSRGNGQGTAYRRGKTWTAQVVVDYRPPSNDDSQPIPVKRTKGGFATKREALEYCLILRDPAAAKAKEAPRLHEYWAIYSDNEYTKLSKSKQTAYKIAWNKLKPIQEARVDAITVELLRSVVSAACPTYYTARDCKSILNALFMLAGADGYANKDLPTYIVLPPLEEKERQPFSEIEQLALWKLYESGDRRAAIPLLMIYTGMMPGEAFGLKVENIDIDNRVIVGAGMKTKVRKATPIVLAEAILPLVDDLIQSAQPSGYIWKRDEDGWYKDYYAALEQAGCRRLTPYSCRHTTATALAVTGNVAPQTVRRVMRWSTAKMLDRYAHPETADALDAVDTIKAVSSQPKQGT